MKRFFIGLGAVAFAALFFLSGSEVLNWYLDSRQSQQEFSQIADLVDNKTPSTERSGTAGMGISGEAETPEVTELTILEEYSAVYEQNNDFVGWILIEDTQINYPVMQSSVDDPDFYLKHNFEKQYSEYGVPYIQVGCDILTSDNLVVYGHHMNNNSMFSDLCKYMDVEFYKEHKTVHFDTKYSHGTYEIIAVFKTVGTEEGFPYHHFVDAEDEQAYDEFIAACKELSLYEIEATAHYGDRLITLSTCEYSQTDGRMVVVAKLIKSD